MLFTFVAASHSFVARLVSVRLAVVPNTMSTRTLKINGHSVCVCVGFIFCVVLWASNENENLRDVSRP